MIGNKIGLSGMEALLRAMEYQTKLLADNKSNGTGLMRLIVGVSVLKHIDTWWNLLALQFGQNSFHF